MSEAILTTLGLGFLMGLKHALDPDHVAVVSAIVSESRSIRRSSFVGTCWGLGHTLSLLIAGALLLVFKLAISDRVALWMEFAVAIMLVAFGARAIAMALKGWRVHTHHHVHEGRLHRHLHLHTSCNPAGHDHRHLVAAGVRPFVAGVVHGIAGSAGLMILVLAAIPAAGAGMLCIATFGLGSTGGMLAMSSLLGIPFVLTARRSRAFASCLQFAAGLGSLSFGLVLAWQYGVRDGLVF